MFKGPTALELPAFRKGVRWPKLSIYQRGTENPHIYVPSLLLFFSRSVVSDSAMPWTAACQASLSFTISLSSLKFMSIESVTPSNHRVLCRPLLLLPSHFPSIRVFSNELALGIRWLKYWSISFSVGVLVCKCWQLVHLKKTD